MLLDDQPRDVLDILTRARAGREAQQSQGSSKEHAAAILPEAIGDAVVGDHEIVCQGFDTSSHG